MARALGRDDWAAGAPVVTVGGAVVAAAQCVPAAGEEVTVDGLRLRVVASDGRAVRQVEVTEVTARSGGDGSPAT